MSDAAPQCNKNTLPFLDDDMDIDEQWANIKCYDTLFKDNDPKNVDLEEWLKNEDEQWNKVECYDRLLNDPKKEDLDSLIKDLGNEEELDEFLKVLAPATEVPTPQVLAPAAEVPIPERVLAPVIQVPTPQRVLAPTATATTTATTTLVIASQRGLAPVVAAATPAPQRVLAPTAAATTPTAMVSTPLKVLAPTAPAPQVDVFAPFTQVQVPVPRVPAMPSCPDHLQPPNTESKCIMLSGDSEGGSSVPVRRNRYVRWTKEDHRLFLLGLEKYGRGNWKNISRYVLLSKTPSQVASHAQKYFLSKKAPEKEKKRRSSIHDTTLHDIDTIVPHLIYHQTWVPPSPNFTMLPQEMQQAQHLPQFNLLCNTSHQMGEYRNFNDVLHQTEHQVSCLDLVVQQCLGYNKNKQFNHPSNY